MCAISKDVFYHLTTSQWKQIKLTLRSNDGIVQVKTAFIDFLADWSSNDWVDWEKIELVILDLKRAKFWRLVPYQQLLDEAEEKVSNQMMLILRKQKY